MLHRARQMARWRACKKTRPHAQHQTRVARGRVFHARTHAARAQTHLSEYERLSGTTPSGIWSPDTVCCRFLTFFSFFFSFVASSSLGSIFFHRKKKKKLLLIIINYNTRRTHLTYRQHYIYMIIIWHCQGSGYCPLRWRVMCVCNLLLFLTNAIP